MRTVLVANIKLKADIQSQGVVGEICVADIVIANGCRNEMPT